MHKELCRVLIVDDELLIRQGIKHCINWEEEGFQIVGEASNGQEALELISATAPHIVLTDIVMPIMDGLELVRLVKQNYQQTEVIILSSFGEYDYVRSTFQIGVVDYILKPKLEGRILLEALQKAVSRMENIQLVGKTQNTNLSIDQIISKLISGQDMKLASKTIEEAFPNNSFCLLGTSLKKQDTNEIVKELTNLLEQIAKDIPNLIFHSCRPNQNQVVFLINVNKEMFSLFKKLLTQTNSKLVLTELFSSLKEIAVIYNQDLKKLLKYRFYFPEGSLLTIEQVPKQNDTCEGFDLDRFIHVFKREQFVNAFTYLEEHITSFSGCHETDIYEFKSFFSNIIFNITILFNNLNYNIEELDKSKYAYFKSIEEAETVTEVIFEWNHFLTEAKKHVSLSQNETINPNMKKILQYISKHYAEPLTLTDVAKHFHFNPSYLSNYFTTHNKESFIEYLNKIRIEEASKLLVGNTAAISEIGNLVGYSDHSYFCKVFKKTMGMSPSQYRKKQQLKR